MPRTFGLSIPPALLRRLTPFFAAVAALGLTATAHADLGVDVTASTYGNVHRLVDPLSASATSVANSPLFLANAFASADISSGILRGSSYGENVGFSLPPEILANSSSSMTDVITFHGSGASVLVDLEMDVDGFFTVNGAPGLTSLVTFAAFTLGNGTSSASLNLDRYYNTYASQDYLDGSVTGSAGTFLDKTLNSATAHLVYLAEVPLNVGLTFNSLLQTYVVPGAPGLAGTVDFSNTAKLSLQLPDGYTYTSVSGHFLSSPAVSPVPEAGSAAMMLVGLAAGSMVVRRRKRET